MSQNENRSGRTKKSHSDTSVKDEEYVKALQIVTDREAAKLERRKSTSVNPKSPRKATRPPLSHENRSSTKHIVSQQRSPKDVPSNYGIPTQPIYSQPALTGYAPPPVAHPMQIPIRPKAVTTQTLPPQYPYHPSYTMSNNHGPPLSNSAYYPHTAYVAPSYPPPSPNNSYMQYAANLQGSPQHDYFAQQMQQPPPRPLADRFTPRTQLHDPVTRTASAFGTRDTRRPSMEGYSEEVYHEDSYASRISDGGARRRDSVRTSTMKVKEQEDARRMPPPPVPSARPGILRKPTTDHALELSDDDDHHDRRERSHLRDKPKNRRPSTNRHSVSYDFGKDNEHARIETANNSRRRQSYYGQSETVGNVTGNDYEDKLNSATNYQADVGGPTVPLTAEVLKKQQRRHGGSSRSTSSRDESDYRKSQTTRTTRSGSNDDENVTIKVTGHARVMVAGTQIDCGDGGEISISRQKSIRNGSERGSEFGGQKQIDDRRSRVDRPMGRSRISSTHSYTRSTPQYQMDNYL